jgi:hypothetical protein
MYGTMEEYIKNAEKFKIPPVSNASLAIAEFLLSTVGTLNKSLTIMPSSSVATQT